MKYFNITVNGVLYQVSAEEVSAPGTQDQRAPGVSPAVASAAPAPSPAAAPPAAPAPAPAQTAPAGGEGLLKAPMPGTIVAVEKAVGHEKRRRRKPLAEQERFPLQVYGIPQI